MGQERFCVEEEEAREGKIGVVGNGSIDTRVAGAWREGKTGVGGASEGNGRGGGERLDGGGT